MAKQLEMIGGKSPRQRMWEAMRAHSQCFTVQQVAKLSNVDHQALRTYIQCLVPGGYIEAIKKQPCTFREYRIIKDTGIEAPRVTRGGKPVHQGRVTEAIWYTLRIVKTLTAEQVVSYVEAAGVDVQISTVRAYLTMLKRAGYLQIITPGNRNRSEKITLKPAMNTGPRPPQIQRVKTVYDPNLNRVMHCEDPEELS